MNLRPWWMLGVAALLLAGCGSDQTSQDDLPPSAPVLVARSADDVYPQTGIRAQPVDRSDYRVYLEWNANPEDDIAGYRVYRAAEDAPDRHYVVADLTLGVQIPRGLSQYSFVDRGDSTGGGGAGNLLAPDPESGESRGYFWTVVAYDEAGNRSAFSQPVYYRLIPNPYPMAVTRTGENQYVVSWQIALTSDNDRPSYYVVRVYSRYRGVTDAALFQIAQRYGTDESVGLDLSAPISPMITDCTYVCQLNAICDRRNAAHADTVAGSASYATFVYQN